jgi:putative ABC transport system permease protein
MRWIDETHGAFFELVRHFLARMFDSDLFSARGQWRTVAVSLFSLAIPAAMVLLDPPYMPHHRLLSGEAMRARAIADDLAMLTLLFSVTGLLALLQWQSLYPSRRDYLALAGLPVRSRQIFAARFVALVLFSVTLVFTVNLLPSVLTPHQFTVHGPEDSWRFSSVLYRLIPGCLGCLSAFFSIVALQGVLLNVLPARVFARASSYIQGLLIAALFLTAFFSWFITDWRIDTIARLPEFGAWLPPVWFAALHRTLAGDRDSFLAAMAIRACFAAVAAPALAAVAYLISFRRYRKLLLESPDQISPRRRRSSPWRFLARDPRQQAVLEFMAHVVGRSRLHRLVLLAYIGAAVGIMVNSALLAGIPMHWSGGWRGTLKFIALYWPLGTSMILLAGVKHVFSIPVELRANWIFQLTESRGRRPWMRAVERFAIVCAVVPIYAALLPVAIYVLGWPLALRMTVMQLLVSLTAFELLFYSWQQLPFTCSYVPGKRPLVSLLATWIGVLGVLVPILSIIIATYSQMTELFLFFLAMAGSIWIWARWRRREGWGDARLIYEDLPDALPNLGIRDMTYRGAQLPLIETAPARPPEPTADPLPSPLLRLQRRPNLEQDLHDELEFHLSMRAQKLGADAPARRQFGNVTSIHEECRDLWRFKWLEDFWQDLRYGARQLRRSPGFTTAAALTLALGIGASTAVFSMCDTVLWRPVPLSHPDRLALILQAHPDNPRLWQPAAPADIADIRRAAATLDDIASWTNASSNLVEAGGQPVRIEQVRVTTNFFDVLGVYAALGRTFLPHDDEPGRDRQVVLSDNCWRRRFDADPAIVGKSIRLDDQNYAVIGVMPADFGFPRAWKELWTPLALSPDARNLRQALLVDSAGRLKPGRTLLEAAAELSGIGARLEQQYPDTNRNRRFVAWTVARYWGGDYVPVYTALLLGATIFVLLIACANIANLQFARASGRSREIAVRTALGAGRRRILVQFLTESLLVAIAGAALGLLAARWALAAVRAGVPIEMRRYMAGWEQIGLNPRAFAWALLAALASAIVAGLAPALRASRPDLTAGLKDGSSPSPARHRLRALLVAGEMALATVLLVGAGLMVEGFQNLVRARATIDPAALLTFHLELSENKYREKFQVAEFYRSVLDRTCALPGVQVAAAATAVPYSRHASWTDFHIEGQSPDSRKAPAVLLESVTPEYFQAMYIPVEAGRFLTDRDGPAAAPVAVISRRMARRWSSSPLGRRLQIHSQGPWITIVGVVGDIEISSLSREPEPAVYLPSAQSPQRAMDIAIRAGADPLQLAPAIRAIVRSIDPEQPVTNLATLAELFRQESFGFSYMAVLMGIFGILALVLSSVGVYGLIAYIVSQQTHEIGVRVALGATRRNVFAAVFRRGMAPPVLGLLAGSIPCYALSRVMRAVFWGVTPAGPVVFLRIFLLLLCAAALAVFLPARRAVRIDPIRALRNE